MAFTGYILVLTVTWTHFLYLEPFNLTFMIVLGPIVLTVECSMLAPGVVLPGNLTLTTSTLYFTIDDDNEETKKIDPQVRLNCDMLVLIW